MSELGRRQKAAACEKSLYEFVKTFWHILEPQTPLVEGWPLFAMCLHLEAVTNGKVKRLLINISPGSMKSLLVNVFWPAWEWIRFPHYRYVTFSYAAHLTQRDNNRFRELVICQEYKSLFGDRFKLVKVGEQLVSNDKTGWKVASSVGGVGTGERGDRVILDDPHNVKQRESEKVRTDTVDWFSSAMSNRLNDLENGVIIVIMQRVHQEDVSGFILLHGLGYVHLMIPAEFEPDRKCYTSIGWEDPRKVEGEIFWEARFSRNTLDQELSRMGPYDYAGQYQQRPTPKGGAIFRDEWWQYYEMPYHGRFPMRFEYVIASLDPAYTAKQQNDYSALTIWGIWRNREDEPKVMLIDGWQKRLTLHGTTDEHKIEGEGGEENRIRTSHSWGLIEWVAYSCKLRKVDRLLIEAKASGLSVAQEISRLYQQEGWGIELIDPRSDKEARAHSIIPLFSDKFIFIPSSVEDNELIPYEFADELIRQCEVFPRGSHDDLVDSMTQALRHLRDVGLAIRREEYAHDYEEARKYRPPLPPLYQT